jgi:nucleoporin POM152
VISEDEAFDIEFGEYDDPRSKQPLFAQPKSTTDKHPPLQRTQRLRWVKITNPGILRLESVQDGRTDVRLRPVETTIVHCPTAKFIGPEEEKVRCGGEKERLTMQMFGVLPLRLEWQRELGGKTEVSTVEGIDPRQEEVSEPTLVAQEVSIPLSLDLDALGEHVYSLNSISDALGNKVDLYSVNPRHKGDYMRTISVLKPAEFSFAGCQAGQTVNLLQGRETKLDLVAGYHDSRDGPWRLNVRFTPDNEVPKEGGTNKKVVQGWTKDLVSTNRNFPFRIEHPGTYTLLGVQGQICKGDVLSPETCRVAEVPVPKADIEWRKLHEWYGHFVVMQPHTDVIYSSGDVGVTANLVLHGQPPFHVYYTTTHPTGQESTNMTVISGSRGEVTLQPERSGSYVYKFTSLSDANYKHIPLNGPVIKQTVHPLASASFASTGPGSGGRGGETTVQSCSGDTVTVPVILKGTAPWNLELQVVGPTGTETQKFTGIKTDRHSIKVKIPRDVDKDGGTVLVDLSASLVSA